MHYMSIYTHSDHIVRYLGKEDISSSLGTIVRDALDSARLSMKTNGVDNLNIILLSHVNAIRASVAKPRLQVLFGKIVRLRTNSDLRIFILGPIWWKLLNAGTLFPAWAN